LDQTSSPHLSQWLCHSIRQEIYVEKFYINQNIKGRTDVNFMFNFSEYLKSTSSKFIIANNQKSLVLDKNPSHATSKSNTQSASQNNSSNSSDTWYKGFTLSPKTSSGTFDRILPLLSPVAKPKLFLDPLLIDNLNDSQKHPNRQVSRSTQSTPKINSSTVPMRSSLKSLTYLSSDKIPPCLHSQNKTFSKSPVLPTESEFINLNISIPTITSPRLHNFLKNKGINHVSKGI